MGALPQMLSWRFRLAKITGQIKHPKLTLLGVVVIAVVLSLFAPLAYRESWLDPFSTLDMPDRLLHPHAISQIGLSDPNDPFHPHFYANQAIVQQLIQSLGQAKLLMTPPNSQKSAGQPMLYFTLHVDASRFHPASDYALEYYPEEKTVLFGDQEFAITDRTVRLFQQIEQNMQTGWWK